MHLVASFDPLDVGIGAHLIFLLLAKPALAKALPYCRETCLFHLRSARRFARTSCRLRMSAAETAVVTVGSFIHTAFAPATGRTRTETAALAIKIQNNFIGLILCHDRELAQPTGKPFARWQIIWPEISWGISGLNHKVLP